MTGDESLYRQYLSGDDEGLNALMKKYGDPLTLPHNLRSFAWKEYQFYDIIYTKHHFRGRYPQ